jgi:hypothetical protein
MIDVENLDTIEEQVKSILKDFPTARNSDIELTIKIWQRFYSDKLTADKNHVKLENLFIIAREASIVRLRSKVQNELNLYLPTEWVIAKRRGILQEQWKTALRYYVESNGQYKLEGAW